MQRRAVHLRSSAALQPRRETIQIEAVSTLIDSYSARELAATDTAAFTLRVIGGHWCDAVLQEVREPKGDFFWHIGDCLVAIGSEDWNSTDLYMSIVISCGRNTSITRPERVFPYA